MLNSPKKKVMSVQDVRERISALGKIDLRRAELDFLKSRLEPLLTGYAVAAPILIPGQCLYRGVPWPTKPEFTHQLGSPPSATIKDYQRANRPNDPRFYCSVARPAPFYELKLTPDSYVAISEWEITDKFFLQAFGYSDEVYSRLGSIRDTTSYWWRKPSPPLERPANKLIERFLAREFTRDVQSGNEHQYKLSAAITEIFTAGTITEGVPADGPKMRQFAGVIYPAVAMWGNADNLALRPDMAEQFLRLKKVEYIHVEAFADGKYTVRCLDFANSFGENGIIEWKGRRPNWQLTKQGEMVIVSVESGNLVVRDTAGNIVEPS